jgi:hypothetical protein
MGGCFADPVSERTRLFSTLIIVWYPVVLTIPVSDAQKPVIPPFGLPKNVLVSNIANDLHL